MMACAHRARCRGSRRRHRSGGFTLVELMFVVAVVGILAATALSFGGEFRARSDFNEVARELFHALSIARTEAVRRGRTATVTFPQGENATDRAIIAVSGDGDVVHRFPNAVGKEYTVKVALDSEHLMAANGATVAYFDFRGFSRDQSGVNFLSHVVCITHHDLSDVQAVQTTIAGAIRILRPPQARDVCSTP